MKKERLETIDAETLSNQPFKPIPFIVDGLLSQGLHILAGAPKVGKSWLALWLAIQVAEGKDVWNGKVKQGTVLYLCLEDSALRIQNRLLTIEDEGPAALHFCTDAQGLYLCYGLEDYLQRFVDENPSTVLIIIDTLQMIRKTNYDNTYASDYRDLASLKKVADKNGIAILLIHHLRKEFDGNVFNRISGTTGISGAVDTSLVMTKEKHADDTAKLCCIGRDIEYREITIRKNEDNTWDATQDSRDNPSVLNDVIVSLLSSLVEEQGNFRGTAAELVSLVDPTGVHGLKDRTIKARIMKSASELWNAGVFFDTKKTEGRRLILLSGVDGVDPAAPKEVDPVDPLVPDGTLFSAIKESSPETEGTECPMCGFIGESGATIPPDGKAAENNEFAESENPGERPRMPLLASKNESVSMGPPKSRMTFWGEDEQRSE